VLALALPNQPEWLLGFLAAQRLGWTAIALDPQQPINEQIKLAESLGASLLIRTSGIENLTPQRRCWAKGTVFVKLTSGSTGLPQPWPCQSSHLLADGKNICAGMGLTPRDRNLGLIPLGHSYGLGNLIIPLLLQGTALAVAPSFLPAQLHEWVPRYRLTVFPSVPAVLRALARLSGSWSRPLRTIISAGAPLPAETARAFHQTHRKFIHNFYGSSETGGIAYDVDGHHSLTGNALGTPLPGVRVHLARGGRVQVSSRAVLTRNHTYLLKDRGAFTPDGALRLLGRNTRTANLGGKKVNLSEIEHTLRQLPGVRESLVWIHRQEGRDHIHAALETNASPGAIHAALAARLSPWKHPKVLHIAPELPRNARGKVDRSALP
jgi:acyl-coenzyme A synthetase/AMP-(fatty) acid ligase